MPLLAEWWIDKSVLVTGPTGIIGSWLVKGLLENGARVTGLIKEEDQRSELYRSRDSDSIISVNGGLEDYDLLERILKDFEIDTVFHLGAQTIVGTALENPLQTFETNIRGTYNLLEACRINSVSRTVVASSDKAYGKQSQLPYTEDMSLSGLQPYEVSKSCTDMLAQSYYHSYELPVAVARCGNVYGGGDLNWSRIVPGTIRSLLKEERPEIRSDGEYVRDYIYVKDVVLAYMRLAEYLENDNVKGQAFNFGNEIPITVKALVKRIQEVMDCEYIEPEILSKAEGEIPSQYLSSDLARRVLSWAPKYDEETGLSETVDWYSKFLGYGK
ncbi:MAG: GDP-mannose 4,6-dehydratase [Chloroflexota bacterium]|nr:GDP-mannose 4,6-dehydratase [Chloroflexota bacterium]